MLDMRANLEIRIKDFQDKRELVLGQRTTNDGLQAFMLFSASVNFSTEDNCHYLCLDLIAMFSENIMDRRCIPIHVTAIKLGNKNKTVKEILDNTLKKYKETIDEDEWKKAKIDMNAPDLGFYLCSDEDKGYIQSYILSSIDEFIPLRYMEIHISDISGCISSDVLLDLNTSNLGAAPIVKFSSPNCLINLIGDSVQFFEGIKSQTNKIEWAKIDKMEWIRNILYNNNYSCKIISDSGTFICICKPWKYSENTGESYTYKFEKDIKNIYLDMYKKSQTIQPQFQKDVNRTLNIFKFKFGSDDMVVCDIHPDDFISTETSRYVFRVLSINQMKCIDWSSIFVYDNLVYKITNIETRFNLCLRNYISVDHQTITIPGNCTIESVLPKDILDLIVSQDNN